MLNPFFQQGSRSEQSLVQSIINESIRMHGVEIYYIPRQYITKKTIIREVIESKFQHSYPIEAYIDTYDGYGNQGTIMSKFGIQELDDLILIVSKERYESYIQPLIKDLPKVELSSRPKEGDLIWFPLGDRLFEIKYVEHEKPFYQLQKNYVYELRCELFRYGNEILDTGIEKIDDLIKVEGYSQTLKLIGAASTASAIASIFNGGVRLITINNRGNGYTSPPTVGFSSSPEPAGTAIGIASMIGGIVDVCKSDPELYRVQSVQIINTGYGYTTEPKISFIGGGGSGAAATATIANGVVGLITITSSGSGYIENTSVVFSTPKHVGASATAIIDTTVSTGGSVTGIIISKGDPAYLFTDTTGGRFYKPGFIPKVTIALPTGSANVAIATAIMGDYATTGGTVDKINVISEGKFYTSIPDVEISHPGFSFAAATIGIAGSSINPNSISFSSNGRAYRTAPTVSISTHSGQLIPLVQAVGIATIDSITGIVTAVGFDTSLPWCVGTAATIGLGYTAAPLINFFGLTSPIQATATATVSISGTVTSISIGNSGFGYASGSVATVTIDPPAGISEQFRALGVATMRYNSVKTQGTIGIGSTYISGINTEGILLGDRVRLQYEYNDIRPEINFIPTNTYVSSIGIGTIFISSTSTNIGVATTSFEFGIDQCGIVTGIAVTYGGGGYLSPPLVTIQNDPEIKNYVELIAGVNTARGYAIVNEFGNVTGIAITDSGSKYVLPPTITILNNNVSIGSSGNFIFNEIITGSISGVTAKVKKWNSTTNELEIYYVSGDFKPGETIIGQTSGSRYVLRSTIIFDSIDKYDDNFQIQVESNQILNFSEKNPFGNP